MPVQLITSSRMAEANEGDKIRLSGKLRTSLGLEIGDIVSTGKDSRFYILDALSEDVATYGERFAFVCDVAISQIEEVPIEPLNPRGMTIGCDPEFILVNDDNKVVNADRVFPKIGQLGSDAGLGELRPPPSKNSSEVVESLRRLIRRIPSKTSCRPLSYSYYTGWVTGFHVHFGMPQPILTYAADNAIEFIRSVVTTLDYYIGIPAMLIDETDLRRLSTFGYGQPGDFRLSECTMEYRTPGGFHLRSPSSALALMEASYVIMEDILGRGELITRYWSDMSGFHSIEHFRDIYGIPNTTVIKKALISRDRDLARSEMDNIRSLYERLFGYSRSKDIIDNLFLTEPKNISHPEMLKNW